MLIQGEEAFLEQIEEIPPTLLRDVDDVKPDIDYAQHIIRMVFISQFRDFILFRRQEAWDLAARNVVGLLSADTAPIGIRAVLLAEAVQSLEGESPFYSPIDHSSRCPGRLDEYF